MKKSRVERARSAHTEKNGRNRPADAAGTRPGVEACACPSNGGASHDERLWWLYAALVGGTDFARTLSGVKVSCREAFRRARTALAVFERERAKEETGECGSEASERRFEYGPEVWEV